MIKALKRKVSRMQFEAPDPTQLSVPPPTSPTDEKPPTASFSSSPKAVAGSGNNNNETGNVGSPPKSGGLPLQYEYQRPATFLDGYTEAELNKYAHHVNRPILVPRKELPGDVGYAEVINAGKSRFNEDQATVVEGKLIGMNGVTIPYLYVGVFDGHGGPGAALKVSKEMHTMLHESLEDVLPYIVNPDKLKAEEEDEKSRRRRLGSAHGLTREEVEEELADDDDETVEVPMTMDSLVSGALESTFWAMDRLIARDKEKHRISGGCTAMVALFVAGRLYVANAGDSRALATLEKEEKSTGWRQMSTDFTPETDRQRVQHIAFHRPELLRHPQSREKLFNRHVLSRKVTKEDIGLTIMYRDYYMTGWSCKDVSPDDVNLVPVISGRGKQCRILSTVGVARSLGDHDLLAKGCGIRVKEFLTPQPEVKVLDLRHTQVGKNDVLVMGTDGLWDVLSNEDVRAALADQCAAAPGADASSAQPSATALAKMLVERARGRKKPEQYWEMSDGRLASGDDITVTVIYLNKGKEYTVQTVQSSKGDHKKGHKKK